MVLWKYNVKMFFDLAMDTMVSSSTVDELRKRKSSFRKEDLGRSRFATEAVAPAGMGMPDFAFYRTQA